MFKYKNKKLYNLLLDKHMDMVANNYPKYQLEVF